MSPLRSSTVFVFGFGTDACARIFNRSLAAGRRYLASSACCSQRLILLISGCVAWYLASMYSSCSAGARSLNCLGCSSVGRKVVGGMTANGGVRISRLAALAWFSRTIWRVNGGVRGLVMFDWTGAPRWCLVRTILPFVYCGRCLGAWGIFGKTLGFGFGSQTKIGFPSAV